MYCQVVVDIATRRVDGLYTYAIPERFLETDTALSPLTRGSAVLIYFRNRPVVGFVVDILKELPKELEGVSIRQIDDYIAGPFFSEHAVCAAQFIQKTYGGSMSEALRPFLSLAGNVRVKKDRKGVISLHQSASPIRFDKGYQITKKGMLHTPRPRKNAKEELIEILKLESLSYSQIKAMGKRFLTARSSLIKEGLIEEIAEYTPLYRSASDILIGPNLESDTPLALNKEQAAAFKKIEELRALSGGVLVLDGVTGSGKTEVYLHALKAVRDEGKAAIVLVPEISLTPQTIARFSARFPGELAVIHSRLSEKERKEQLELIARGICPIVVGARSALMVPLENLGLIIIDEEHDTAYKQENAPRYHTRDVAEHIATELSIPLVLGSATPSLETLHSIKEGRYHHVVMSSRVEGRSMPEVVVVDRANEFRVGRRSVFSEELHSALKDCEAQGSKAMLLLNRRGFASFLLCRECGYVPECESCSTSMTLHKRLGHLRCHQCNALKPIPSKCPKCSSPYIQQFGMGTQALEEEMHSLFPNWQILRMDADTTAGPGGHEKILDEFKAAPSAVLIGTQMIAKGHDFPEVTLVGVVAADVGLHISDFHAAERSYQLLAQVSGRSGRGEKSGKVIIQTYLPDHPAIVAVKNHDRDFFLAHELGEREELGYPPFKRMANIMITSPSEMIAFNATNELAATIKDSPYASELEVLGPAPCPITRIKKRYRYHLLVKAERGYNLGEVLHNIIKKQNFEPGTNVALDVDPNSLM